MMKNRFSQTCSELIMRIMIIVQLLSEGAPYPYIHCLHFHFYPHVLCAFELTCLKRFIQSRYISSVQWLYR